VRSITDIARKHRGVYRLDAEERQALEEGLAQAERGEFVSDEVLAEADRRHGL
jgi:predicted transcriptional regulator